MVTSLVGATEHTILGESVSDSSLPVAAAEGLVTWSEGATDGGHALMVLDSESGASYQVDASKSPFLSSIGGGWLAWSAGGSVRGVSLDELRASF